MHNSYFHHVASCLVINAKPLSYNQYIAIINKLGY